MRDIRGQRITVIGAARSGLAAARLAVRQGAQAFVSEFASRDAYAEAVVALDAANIPGEFGGHTERAYEADLFVVSPGVPSDAPVVLEAARRGIPLVGELEFGARWCECPVVAVTGTNGKTTTTMLTGALLQAAGKRVIVAGNIGHALCDALLGADAGLDAAVLEVSSYQLDMCVDFHPAVAMITTITPDHLARYGNDFEKYLASKQRVFMNQTPDDAIIYNADSVDTVRAILPSHSRRMAVSVTLIPERGGWLEGRRLMLNIGHGREVVASIDDLQLRGRHNYMNILMAAVASRLLGATPEAVHDAACAFEGVEHRLEPVRRINGVMWVNDSKATNVDSLIIALQSFHQPVVLIAGGRDKGAPYDPVLPLIDEKVKAAVLIGEAADAMEAVFASHTEVHRAASMPDAVAQAAALAASGDAVLLSPACASFDMFENFEHRGLVFKKLVHALIPEQEA